MCKNENSEVRSCSLLIVFVLIQKLTLMFDLCVLQNFDTITLNINYHTIKQSTLLN